MCYKVGWKNYGSDEDTWEPESNLIGAHELLKAYKLKYNIGIKPKKSVPLSFFLFLESPFRVDQDIHFYHVLDPWGSYQYQ